MRLSRIYINQDLQQNSQIVLAKQTSHYLLHVLRFKKDQRCIIFNGTGGEYQAQVSSINKNKVVLLVNNFLDINRESPLVTHLGLVISRGERMDYAVQKATELGVQEISPLFSTRCEVKLSTTRTEKKQKHWQQVAISTCEQSGRNKIPVIHQPGPLNLWLKTVQSELNIVFDTDTDAKLDLSGIRCRSIGFLIGPEGGLSDEELQLAHTSQFQSLSIGPRILRTETAPVVALSLFQYLLGDLS